MNGPFFVQIDRRSTTQKPRVRIFVYPERNSENDIEVPSLGKVFEMARTEVSRLRAEKVPLALDHVEVRIRRNGLYLVLPSMDWQQEGEPVMHELKRDGNLIETGPENYLFFRLHSIQGQSWDYALKHGGYSIQPIKF